LEIPGFGEVLGPELQVVLAGEAFDLDQRFDE
jgi:hypothetical protein